MLKTDSCTYRKRSAPTTHFSVISSPTLPVWRPKATVIKTVPVPVTYSPQLDDYLAQFAPNRAPVQLDGVLSCSCLPPALPLSTPLSNFLLRMRLRLHEHDMPTSCKVIASPAASCSSLLNGVRRHRPLALDSLCAFAMLCEQSAWNISAGRSTGTAQQQGQRAS